MKAPTAAEVQNMTGTEILSVLAAVVADERRECARIADDLADRLAKSGKEGSTAQQIGATIRARG